MSIQKAALTLADQYSAHRGKVSDKWSSYLEIYERVFEPYRSAPIRFLEIGIQNGGSLEIWARYFAQATAIVGCDINPSCGSLRYSDERIRVVVGDANTSAAEHDVESLAPRFDVIIDDGSHRSRDIVRSFSLYFPRLESGGVFVVEDLHCSYWKEFDGGLVDPWSSISFFKRLADVINHEHWGVPYLRAEILQSFCARYGARFAEEDLAQIHSVEFLNSICVIRKRSAIENTLGLRVIVGEEAIAEPPSASSGSTSKSADQAANAWSVLPPLPEDELMALRTRVARLEVDADSFGRRELQFAKAEARLGAALEEKDREIQTERKHARAASSEASAQAARAMQLAKAIDQQCTQIHSLLQSHSWRVTAPLRWSGLQARRALRTARLAATLSRRVGGLTPLVRSGFVALQREGWTGVRAKLRDLESGALRGAAIAGRPGDTETNDANVFEDIAREIFATQQAEITAELAEVNSGRFARRPLISVVMPVYKTPIKWLRRAVESLQQQYYDNWELCAVDDCSPTSEQRDLLQELASLDPRVRVMVMERNGGISKASNAALEMARGEFIALVDHDDEITPDAFYRVVEAINEQPNTDFIYSDECKIDDTAARRLFHFIFKPDWSPEVMFNGMLTGHLTVYSKALVERVGGFRSEYDFSQDYDLALRAAEVAERIVHIERLLYLWRSIPGSAASGGKDFARESNIAALRDALRRRGIPGDAVALPHANCVRVSLPTESEKVSIVIPSDSVDNLRKVLRALREGTDYPNYEVVVVCNGPLAERLADEFDGWASLFFVHYNKKYNFSDKCNEGARASTGDIVVFYNDDVFPLQSSWIDRLIEYLKVPGVGATSPKLLHEDDTIQYAGMISGTPGLCGTAYNHCPSDGFDAFLTMHRFVRNVSILSGACCALRRDLFWAIGGFDAVNTPDGHSDMDLSYKLLEAGYRCVYTPYSVLRHIGNHSWGAKRHKYKADMFALRRWGKFVSTDPYFTESMKRVLYHDFRFNYRIYAEHIERTSQSTGPDVLFVSHELSLTGAPRMLFYAAKAVLKSGGFPVVVAPQDGPMREEMIRAGIVVIIDASIRDNHFLFERFARNFDLAVVNTIALESVVRQLSNISILRTVWWLHEAQSLADYLSSVKEVQWSQVRVLCVSDYARGFVPPRIDAETIYNGIPDDLSSVHASSQDEDRPFTFLMAGTIEPRKGQDIFVSAVALLPLEMRRRCRFVLTGKLWPMYEEFWAAQQARLESLPEIVYRGLLGHDTLLGEVSAADVVVCCSRDEPFSLVATEAAMLARPAILSDRVGSAEIFEHGVACLVCEAESAPALAQRMMEAYGDRPRMRTMGQMARKRFEEQLTEQEFSQRFLAIVEKDSGLRK